MIIGIDVGTTATKAVVFEVGGERRHTAIREYPLRSPHPGWQVQDPAQIRAAVLATVAEAVRAAGGVGVIGVSVSSAMYGLIGLDQDGDPLTDLITWADGRSANEARGLRTSELGREVYRASVTPVHPMTPLTKLMWSVATSPSWPPACGGGPDSRTSSSPA